MVNLFAPQWFFGIDSILEFISLLIVLAFVMQSTRAYSLSKKERFLYLGGAFGLLSISLVSKIIAGTVIHFGLVSSSLYQLIFNLGFVFSMLSTLFAYFMFTTIFLKIDSIKVMSLILTTFIFWGIVGSQSVTVKFNIFAIIMLAHVAISTAQNYVMHGKKALFTFVGFSALLVSHVLYILAPFENSFYALAQIAQLLAYLILYLMLRSITKGTVVAAKKKRNAKGNTKGVEA